MTYEQALNYIHSIPKFRRPLGNANLARLMETLGDPQDKTKFIHIAGTNGKGSTAAMLDAVLRAEGYKTGLFTSPYIEVFNERIRVNGELISNDALAEYTERVKTAMDAADAPVSEFAFVTAIAFLYFYDQDCDFIVLETGMGGRLDATNLIKSSVVSVITSIGLDHTQYLGETIEEIAREKCGIIKENGFIVSYPNPAVSDIIETACSRMNAKLVTAKTPEIIDGGFIYGGKKYDLALKGSYQPQNAAVALETLFAMRNQGIKINDRAIEYGLANVQWQARFEFIGNKFIIDGGHNIDGIRALKKSLLDLCKPYILVMAMMEDKAYTDCIREIADGAKAVFATYVDMPRCLKPEKFKEILSKTSVPVFTDSSIERSLRAAEKFASNGEIICICGSLYLAGEARKILRKEA